MVVPDGQGGGFFGRRKGKKLREAQAERIETVLPRLALPDVLPADLTELFTDTPIEGLRLEIGFGGGEHLAHEAEQNSRLGFIGCEVFINGVAKLVAEVEGKGLSNIRIHHGDAALLLKRLPKGAFRRVDLLYPDPWPKRRQRKRRFVSPERLSAIADLLEPGGEFRFATDIDDYSAWTLMRIAAEPKLSWAAQAADDWRRPWDGWIRTRYEAKAIREGRPPAYFRFVRSAAP